MSIAQDGFDFLFFFSSAALAAKIKASHAAN